jgi:hypothetical protein
MKNEPLNIWEQRKKEYDAIKQTSTSQLSEKPVQNFKQPTIPLFSCIITPQLKLVSKKIYEKRNSLIWSTLVSNFKGFGLFNPSNICFANATIQG